MAVSGILMGRWSHKLRKILEDSEILLLMLTVYVDDVRLVVERLKNGQFWCGEKKRFVMTEDRKVEDKAWTREAQEAHTKKEYSIMMSSIYKINFTTETASEFPNNRLPTLDTEWWLNDDGTISYSFYRSQSAPHTVSWQNLHARMLRN